MNRTPFTLEVCLDSAESAAAAREGGARRIELCASMASGGITPSHGIIRAVRSAVRIPLYVLVRPRPGDFIYSPAELRSMTDDILAARDLGADGVVVGALTGRRTVDSRAMARLVRAAGPMGVTFHRAFDHSADGAEALGALVDLGVERVLTTGGAATAFGGRKEIAKLVGLSRGRIAVMAGGGIQCRTVARLLAETGVMEVHVGSAVAALRQSGRGAYRAPIATVTAPKVAAFLERMEVAG